MGVKINLNVGHISAFENSSSIALIEGSAVLESVYEMIPWLLRSHPIQVVFKFF